MLVKALACLTVAGCLASCTTSSPNASKSSSSGATSSPSISTSAASPATTTAPPPITLSIISNLDRKPLPARVEAQGVTRTAPSGTITLTDVPPRTPMRVTSTGYAPRTVTSDGRIVLSAGPAATATFLANAQIAQRYQVQATFVHPLEYRYVTRKQMIDSFRTADNQGYSLLRWSLKSVTVLPHWRFPGCNGRGATTFKHVPAVEFRSVSSAPSGGQSTDHGVEHLVLSDGLWRWFPIVPTYC
jgi:hypothetical protein